ncbi:MAG: TM2 domain-containing protein [Flavobacteriales bacterium]|nr:TM2 domain-containing protein [Flavobacteriales bacterium]
MSDTNNSQNYKKDIQKGAKKIKEKAKEFAKEIDQNTKEFQEEAKSTAEEFTKGAKKAYQEISSDQGSKRIVVGVVAILFGALGIHKFILGYQKEGIVMLVLSLLSLGFLVGLVALIGIVEGIIYLRKSDEEFFKIYQEGRRPWF